MVVAQWVRPAIQHAQEVPLVSEASSILLSSLWAESLFVFHLLFHFFRCFSIFYFGCVLHSKVELIVLDLFFDFLVCYLFSMRLESEFQKNSLSSFNPVWVQWAFLSYSCYQFVVSWH